MWSSTLAWADTDWDNLGKNGFSFKETLAPWAGWGLALTNVQYAVSYPQKAYESQRDRVSERWNSMTNTCWQIPAPLAAIFSFPTLRIPRSSSNNPYTFIFLLCTSHAFSLFSSEAPPRSSYSFTKFLFGFLPLFLLQPPHQGLGVRYTYLLCVPNSFERMVRTWRESVRGEITNTPAE